MSARGATKPPERIWIVCPVYFDVPSWTILHKRLDAALDSDLELSQAERRFVVFDDSAGADPEIARIADLPGVRMVTPRDNQGNQQAIVHALRDLVPEIDDEDLIVTMDADGEDAPEDVPRLLAKVGPSASDPMRVVLAKRTGRRRGAFSMQLFYPLYRVLFAALTGVTAATGNFAAFTGATAAKMLRNPSFDFVYSASLISVDEIERTYLPCEKGNRYEGKPKIDLVQHMRQARVMLIPFGGQVAKRLSVATLALITLIGLLLRLPAIGDSLFGDELSTFYVVHGHGLREAMAIVRGPQEATPPLYFGVAWLFSQLGDSLDLLRVPSLLVGVATIPLTYLLGTRTVGRGPGLVAAALVAVSPLMIFYSDEARAYALEAFLVLCSTLALIAALRTSTWWRWGLYAVLIALAMYSHYTAVFVLAVQTGWALIVWKDRRREIILSLVAAAILFVPWLSGYRADSDAPGAMITDFFAPFDGKVFVVFSSHWVFSALSAVKLSSLPGIPAVVAFCLGIAIGLVDRAVRGMSRPNRNQTLIILLAIAAPVGAGFYSLVGPSVFLPRNLIASWPGFALAVGMIVWSARPRLRLIAVVLVVGAMTVGGVRTMAHDQRRPDYNRIVSFLVAHGRSGDSVVDLPAQASGDLLGLDVELVASDLYSGPDGFSVDRIGFPTADQLTRNGRIPGVLPVFVPLPDPQRVAQRAAARSASGRVFLVLRQGVVPDRLGKPGTPDAELVREFLSGLPDGYEVIRFIRLPGAQGYAPSIYEFNGARTR